MVVKHLGANRILGSSTGGDVTTGWTITGTTNTPNGTTNVFDFGEENNTNHNGSYDLGSGNVAGNVWALRCKMVMTDSDGGSSDANVIIGLSDSATGGGNTNQDFIVMRIHNADVNLIRPNHGSSSQPRVGQTGSNQFLTVDEDVNYYIELKRTSDTQFTWRFTTNSAFTGGSSGTVSISAGTVTGLRYIKIMNVENCTSCSSFTGYIDDLQYWDDGDTTGTATHTLDFSTTDEKATLITGTALVGMASAGNGSISGATHSTTSPPVGTGWLDFDGSNDHFTADGVADAMTTIGTVSVWFHTDGYSSGDGDRLFEFGDGSGEFLASIASTQKISLIMQHGSTMQWNGSTDVGSITDDTWYHLVITQNGTSPKFWIGALGSAITDQTNLSTTTDVTKWFESSWNSFEIGVNQAHSGGRLDGGISEFACWNTVLTDSQISDLHNSSGNGVSASTISAGLRVLFNFDVDGEVDNKALSGTTYSSNLEENTIFIEKDTQKQYWLLSSNEWKANDLTRGLTCIGDDGGNSNVIDYVVIDTLGNATDFGDVDQARFDPATFADATRGVIAGGGTSASQNTIDYVTVATESNASDFGDLITAVKHCSGCADATRGLSCGGVASSYTDTIEYVTIQTPSGGTDFGNLATSNGGSACLADSTRGVIAGGYEGGNSDRIQYVTIASAGNSSDFGDLSHTTRMCAGLADSTRGVILGGEETNNNYTNKIDYITIQTTGAGTDFGDLTVAKQELAGFANTTRGCVSGGSTGSPINVIEYITIQTLGNGTDFGDITVARRSCSGLSA